jgi:hypothetical protein
MAIIKTTKTTNAGKGMGEETLFIVSENVD